MSDAAAELLQRDVAYRAARLSGRMRSLGSRLLRLADQLDREPLEALLNSLGEIQTEGSSIDAECGGYMATRDALRAVRART